MKYKWHFQVGKNSDLLPECFPSRPLPLCYHISIVAFLIRPQPQHGYELLECSLIIFHSFKATHPPTRQKKVILFEKPKQFNRNVRGEAQLEIKKRVVSGLMLLFQFTYEILVKRLQR